jgi:hypothetical protein
MRIMDDVIADHGLEHELEDRLIEETGNSNFFLGFQASMDDPSDAEDPEQQLRTTVDSLSAEAVDQSAMVQAVQGALYCRGVTLHLERAVMELEDIRSRQL